MGEFDIDKIEYLIYSLKSHVLKCRVDYDSKNKVVTLYPYNHHYVVHNKYNVNSIDYQFLRFKIKELHSPESTKFVEYVIDEMNKDRWVDETLIKHLVSLEIFTEDYEYNFENIRKYENIKDINRLNSCDDEINKLQSKIAYLKNNSEIDKFSKTNITKTLEPKINDYVKNTQHEYTNDLINTEHTNYDSVSEITNVYIVKDKDDSKILNYDAKKDDHAKIMIFNFIVFVIGFGVSCIDIKFGTFMLLYNCLNMGISYDAMRRDGYKLNNLFNNGYYDAIKVLEKEKNNKIQWFNSFHPKPVKEIAMLTGRKNCENIVNLGEKYDDFSFNDKVEYNSCIKDLIRALRISKNKLYYSDKSGSQNELFNELLVNVNKVMDNIAYNLAENDKQDRVALKKLTSENYSF